MKRDRLAYLVATDPIVVRQHMGQDPATGRPMPTPFDELSAKADSIIDLVIPRLLDQEAIKRRYMVGTYTIAAGDISGDTVTLPENVATVLHITKTTGNQERTLTKLADPSEVVEWQKDNTPVDTDNSSVRAYYSFSRTSTGRIKLTMLPSSSGAEGLTVWFTRNIGDAPYNMTWLPERLHYIIYETVLAYMRGARIQEAIMAVVGETAESIEPIEAGVTKMKHDPDVERSNLRRNAIYTPPY